MRVLKMQEWKKAGVKKSGVDSRGGKCRSGKCRSDNVWKAVKKEKYTPSLRQSLNNAHEQHTGMQIKAVLRPTS